MFLKVRENTSSLKQVTAYKILYYIESNSYHHHSKTLVDVHDQYDEEDEKSGWIDDEDAQEPIFFGPWKHPIITPSSSYPCLFLHIPG